jgi:hypothetical protein
MLAAQINSRPSRRKTEWMLAEGDGAAAEVGAAEPALDDRVAAGFDDAVTLLEEQRTLEARAELATVCQLRDRRLRLQGLGGLRPVADAGGAWRGQLGCCHTWPPSAAIKDWS